MAAMRRAKFILATWPILLTLLSAPLLHTHVRAENNRALQSAKSRVAVVHAHFPEEQGASAAKNGRPADLDHSSNEAKPFNLLALVTLRSPTVFLEMVTCAAAPPVFLRPLIVPFERANIVAVPSIHDPPGLRRLTLRGPPAEFLI